MNERQVKINISAKFLHLFLSSLIVAISFMSFILPMAVFQLTHVALRKNIRSSAIIMFNACFIIFMLALFSGSIQLFLSFWVSLFIFAPLFLLSLIFRKKRNIFLTAITMFLTPILLFLFSIWRLPIYKKTIEELFIKSFADKIGENSLSLPNTVMESFSSLVFGNMTMEFFAIIVICLTNLIIMDIVFEQYEKINSVVLYVKENENFFPKDFFSKINNMSFVKSTKYFYSGLNVTHVSKLSNNLLLNVKKELKLHKAGIENLFFDGYLFEMISDKKVYRLKNIMVPFVLVILSLAFFLWLFFNYMKFNTFPVFSSEILNITIIFLGFISLMVTAFIATQGILVGYLKLSPIIWFGIILGAFVLELIFPQSHIFWLMFLIIGLVDYAYDLRELNVVNKQEMLS